MAVIGENSVKGTEFKLNINMTPIGGYRLDNVAHFGYLFFLGTY